MKLYLYTMNLSLLLVTLILGILVHYGVQRVFIFYRKFDDYNHRSSHNTLATRTGGIGVFTVVLLISIFYYIKGVEVFDYSLLIPLGIMFIVGVYDDFYNADFKLKFFKFNGLYFPLIIFKFFFIYFHLSVFSGASSSSRFTPRPFKMSA